MPANAHLVELAMQYAQPIKLVYDEWHPEGIWLPAHAITGEAAREMERVCEEMSRPDLQFNRWLRETCGPRGCVIEKESDMRTRGWWIRHNDDIRLFEDVLSRDDTIYRSVAEWIKSLHDAEVESSHP